MRSDQAWLVVLAAVGLTPAVACNENLHPPPTTPPPDTIPLTAPQSFTVQGTLRLLAPVGGAPYNDVGTSQESFILRVDPAGATMIMGAYRAVTAVPLTSKDGVVFQASNPVSFPVQGGACYSSATYTDFHFTAGADSIAGTATGMADIVHGDVAVEYTAQLDFTGVPDTTAPTISGTGPGLDPLAQASFPASEPLPATATARLVSPTGEQVPLSADPLSAPSIGIVGFRRSTDALRYGTTYTLVVDRWIDLAGNRGVTPDDVTTLPPPPLVPEDGFESAPDALGGATILDAATMPSISGAKSAVIGLPGQFPFTQPGRFTVRLAVNPGDRFVRLSLRPFSVGGNVSPYNTDVRLAVPGGATVSVKLPSFTSSTPEQATVDGAAIILGDAVPIEAALPAGVGNEVVFDLMTSVYGSEFCGPPQISPGYQIDDLRVE